MDTKDTVYIENTNENYLDKAKKDSNNISTFISSDRFDSGAIEEILNLSFRCIEKYLKHIYISNEVKIDKVNSSLLYKHDLAKLFEVTFDFIHPFIRHDIYKSILILYNLNNLNYNQGKKAYLLGYPSGGKYKQIQYKLNETELNLLIKTTENIRYTIPIEINYISPIRFFIK